MRRQSASPAFELLQRGQAAGLLARAGVLARLQRLIEQQLPEPLGAHCTVLNRHNETLVLAADSPVWASRLRFLAPQLIKQLECQPQFRVRTVQVLVRPQAPPEPSPPRRRASISATTGRLLEQTAAGVADERLGAALRRLAARGGRS